jgi:hypothetical protein
VFSFAYLSEQGGRVSDQSVGVADQSDGVADEEIGEGFGVCLRSSVFAKCNSIYNKHFT